MQANIPKKLKEPANRKKRFLIVLCSFTAVFTLLFCRVFYLQIIQGPSLVQRALSQWTRVTSVEPKRGDIVDRNGEVLAQVRHGGYRFAVSQKDCGGGQRANHRGYAGTVAGNGCGHHLGKGAGTSKSEVWLKRQIDRDVADQIRALNLTGVGFMVDTKRYYPKGDFLTQVLGFTSVDGEGLEGVEAYYNKYLAGTPGELRAQTDVKGNEIAFGEEYYVPATDGYTVSLTIDYVIQSFVEKACADAYAQYNPKGVMCIAVDPNTGEILALCNKQSYDLNSPPRDDTETLNELSRNRILADANDPGSIFKVFTMAAALDTGQTKDSETFTCNGSIKVQNTTIRCTSTHGTVI